MNTGSLEEVDCWPRLLLMYRAGRSAQLKRLGASLAQALAYLVTACRQRPGRPARALPPPASSRALLHGGKHYDCE